VPRRQSRTKDATSTVPGHRRARLETGSSPNGHAAFSKEPSLQVVERAFAILEAFTEDRVEWSTSDLARSIGLPIPTTHRLLGALKRLGYLTRDEDTKRFRLGGAALRLGDRGRALNDLRTIAVVPLRQLSEAASETALLTVLNPERNRSVCVERVETNQALRLSVEPGRLLPLHAGASQKALLAFMPEQEVEQLLDRPLERLCTSTITDRRSLARELEIVRERGWASSHEETNVGVWGLAVPVISGTDVVCAVGIAGPSPRLSGEVIRASLEKVHDAAQSVARSLGFTTPPVTPPS
jgi:DNA-binding IclR family transcriptional regulator